MKNKQINVWRILVILSVCFLIIHDGFAQNFGNNFRFQTTRMDFRFMVKQKSTASFKDTQLDLALSELDPLVNVGKKGVQAVNSPSTIIFPDTLRKPRVDVYKKVEGKKIYYAGQPTSPIILGVKLNPKLEKFYTSEVNSMSKSFACYIINDSTDAILVGLGITTENVSDYKYHVVENDSNEIVPWSPIPKLEQKYGASRPYAFFGKFKAIGKQLLIEVVNSKNYTIRDGVIFDWRVNYKPVVNQIIVSTPRGYFNINYRKLNRDYATKFDSISGLPLDLKFPVDSINNFRLNFKSHPTIPYVVYLKQEIQGKTETKRIDYYVLKDDFDFSKEHFKTPGKYELIIHRVSEPNYYGEDNILRIPFEVIDPPNLEKRFTARQIIPLLLGLVLIFITTFLIYYLGSKRRLFRSIRLKEKTELQLKSIRSQLNPHFMFNALSSIQNLMNRNEAVAANHYLTIFSNLTRRVLNTGDQELISLDDEISLLDDYLQMEQLRFGFKYAINVNSDLDKANIEIPAMLLQPLVENAVKHGISSLRGNGTIEATFEKDNKALILSVTDNGKGFDENSITLENKGLGLKLCRERIVLLNKIYSKQLITMEFIAVSSGTKVNVILNDWL